MGEIILIRHGQANSAATDEESYDKLSELGHQQARWLGEHLRLHGEEFDTVLSGTLIRHQETAASMGLVPDQMDARLNELDYFNLSDALEKARGVPRPDSSSGPTGFAEHMPRVMKAWHDAEIQGQESFANFESRIKAVLKEAEQPGRRVICVTSGGVIGMALRHLLGLDALRMAHILLPIFNTSIHRVAVRPQGAMLAGFNATPHLDAKDRVYAKTHY
ncbi:MAG: histidine phosphatase family protein [Rhodobacteraceae bacterium]|nr:histidine phosphatase family protein [Paracoccaceae bacterium]